MRFHSFGPFFQSTPDDTGKCDLWSNLKRG
jgi:hypothetical protein